MKIDTMIVWDEDRHDKGPAQGEVRGEVRHDWEGHCDDFSVLGLRIYGVVMVQKKNYYNDWFSLLMNSGGYDSGKNGFVWLCL